MKILILNTSDSGGGAARAAYRLHKSLLTHGVDSIMLVKNKYSNDQLIYSLSNTKSQKVLSKIIPVIDRLPIRSYKNKTQTLFSPSRVGERNLIKRINEINPDIVHLHWVNAGFLKIEDLKKIKAPIVWSLHDMWAFTGGCHYDEMCNAYKKNCGKCKVLGSVKENDLSRKLIKYKIKNYKQIKNITIVGLSNWIYKCAKSSNLLKNMKHVNLPNPIDIALFKPFDKEKARELWNLPKDKQLILFGAMGATTDPRKGYIELKEAIKKLKSNKNIEFVIFGSNKPKNAPDFGFITHYLGNLTDDISLVTLYSAVDVMVVPSIQENLSNAIMESLACATPVVGFAIGGNSDMISHHKTGYLVKPYDTNDLANGIEWVLNNKDYNTLCTNARAKVLNEFDSNIVAKKYITLYNKILKSL